MDDQKKIGFAESVLPCVGKLIHVHTIWGWGWIDHRQEPIEPLSSFSLRLIRFWDYQFVVRRGGVGRIESTGHVADGLWLFFALRAWGGYDLENHPARCNILFFDHAPEDPHDNATPWPFDWNTPVRYAGFGEIVKNPSIGPFQGLSKLSK